MQPQAQFIRDIAIWDPVAALGILCKIPQIPLYANCTGVFQTFDVLQPPIEADLDTTISSRVWIDSIRYRCMQPNVFAGSVNKTVYDSNLKLAPGVDILCTVHSGPRYLVSPNYTPLENFANDVFDHFPAGWPLFKQQSIQLQLKLVQSPPATSPNAPPYIITVTFRGWQFLDHTLDEMQADEAVKEIARRWPWVLDPANRVALDTATIQAIADCMKVRA